MATSTIGSIVANLEMNSAQFKKELESTKKRLNKMEGRAKKTNKEVSKLQKAFHGVGKGLTAIEGPMGGFSSRMATVNSLVTSGTVSVVAFGAAFAGAAFLVAKAVKEFDKVEQGQLRQQAVLRATGNTAGFTATQLDNMARRIALSTLASTEGIREAQNALLTFRSVAGPVFTQAIELSQDLADVLGGSAASNAKTLGKALEDPIKGISALTRVGVSFSEQQKTLIKRLANTGQKAEAQRVILAELKKQVGGAAEGAAGGLSGAVDTLGQRWSELLENFARTSGSGEAATGFINGLANFVKDIDEGLQSIIIKYKVWAGDQAAVKGLTVANAQATERQNQLFNERLALSMQLNAAQAKQTDDTREATRKQNQIRQIKQQIAEIDRQLWPLSDAITKNAQKEAAAHRASVQAKKEKAEQDMSAMTTDPNSDVNKQAKALVDGEMALRSALSTQTQVLAESLLDQEESIAVAYMRRQQMLDDALAAGVLSQKRYNVLSNRLEAKRIGEETTLKVKTMTELQKFEAKNWKERTRQIVGQLAATLQAYSGNSKTMFKLAKAAAISNAIVNTYQGVTQALAAYPPPISFAMAAAQLAAGMGQVQSIKSQEFGSSSASSDVGSAADPGEIEETEIPEQQSNQTGPTEISISIDDDGIFTGKQMRRLVDEINEVLADDMRLSA